MLNLSNFSVSQNSPDFCLNPRDEHNDTLMFIIMEARTYPASLFIFQILIY
jgi:hypothetical protein